MGIKLYTSFKDFSRSIDGLDYKVESMYWAI